MACCTAPRSSGSRCASADGAAAAVPGSSSVIDRIRARGRRIRRPRFMKSACQLPAQETERVGGREFLGGFRAPMAVFELPFFQAAVTHDHAVWNADELGVGELDARPLVAVVEQCVDAGGDEVVVETFCGFT